MNKTLTSINPATLEQIAEIPIASAEQVEAALLKAKDAAPAWAALSYKDRAKYVIEFRLKIQEHLDDLAQLISQENGKPLTDALSSDLIPVIELCAYFAKQTQRILRKERIWLGKWDLMGRSSSIEYKPLGVVGIISPWNYPFSIPAGQTMMAVMAGNAVVLKPSEYTPLIGEKIAELARLAGFPDGVINVVTGDGSTGAALIAARPQKIFFTGSVGTGKRIMAAAAEHLTPVALELGGKDPMIVLADANVDFASSAAVWGAFSNNGQVCASVERLYVHEKIADAFIEQVVTKTQKLNQTIGSDPDADVSVLNNEAQLEKVEAHVTAALKAGAVARTGGERLPNEKGYFFPPTVLTGVDKTMPVVHEETFGPVLPIMRFTTEDEAIRAANDSPYGLTASVWSQDRKKALRIARQLESGTVTINENVYTYALAQTPWGGPKWSGIGRTHGKHGLLEMVEPQHIHINKVTLMKDLWWYSYDQARYNFLSAMVDAFFAKGMGNRLKGVGRMLGLMRKLTTH
jgi:succinate-semialdehyde dehydrogenase/glutarate-semialdehyde dehydrogenase